MPRRLLALLPAVVAVLALGLLASCSEAPAATTSAAAPTTTGAGAATTTSTTLVPVGEPVNKFTLNVGDCINRYDAADITTRLSCDTPHDREVFAKATYPAPFGQPYPGDDVVTAYASKACYDQFAAYVGQIYELSSLGLGAIIPTKDNFEDAKARYRGITCFLVRNDHQQLAGSMHNSKR